MSSLTSSKRSSRRIIRTSRSRRSLHTSMGILGATTPPKKCSLDWLPPRLSSRRNHSSEASSTKSRKSGKCLQASTRKETCSGLNRPSLCNRQQALTCPLSVSSSAHLRKPRRKDNRSAKPCRAIFTTTNVATRRPVKSFGSNQPRMQGCSAKAFLLWSKTSLLGLRA